MKSNLKFILLFSCFVYSQDCCEVESAAIVACDGMIGCYIPQCDEDCQWESMQCWWSTGYCWCVDENGMEINGTNTPSWEGYPDCSSVLDCDEGFISIGDFCYFEQDINLLETFIDNSLNSINLILDTNNNEIIEPLELCIQDWENGRLRLLDCNPIIIDGVYNWLNISGEIPQNINNWDSIDTFLMPYNELSGLIPESICDLNVDFSNESTFDLNSNNLCPPYPECVEDYIWSQSNWGSGSCELSDCYDFGIGEVAFIEVDGDNILNPIDDLNGIGTILVNVHNDGPSCSQYPGLMITTDTPGVSFPYWGSGTEDQFETWWYAIFADMTYFSNVQFEVSPFIPLGTEIIFTIETITMNCYDESCIDDPYCHDCPLTPPVLVSMVVGQSFPNMLGDANIDGNIDVLDILQTVNYILYTNQDEIYGPGEFLFNLINLNGDDIINITDVVNLVNIILD